MNPIVWLIALIVLLVVEAITVQLTTIWFAGGALSAFLAGLLHADIWIQFALFLAVSILLLLFTRPAAMKYLNKEKTPTNVDSLIGEQAIVTQDINNLMGRGEALVGGMEWSARSAHAEELIPKDTVVRILRIDGVKLIVEKKEREA